MYDVPFFVLPSIFPSVLDVPTDLWHKPRSSDLFSCAGVPMNRRHLRLLLLLASFTFAAAGSGSVQAFWGKHVWSTRITRENAARLREGMTLAEVEAVFGGPERKEVDIPWTTFLCSGGSAGYFGPPYTTRVWASNELIIAVFFRDGRAEGTFRDNRFVPMDHAILLRGKGTHLDIGKHRICNIELRPSCVPFSAPWGTLLR